MARTETALHLAEAASLRFGDKGPPRGNVSPAASIIGIDRPPTWASVRIRVLLASSAVSVVTAMRVEAVPEGGEILRPSIRSQPRLAIDFAELNKPFAGAIADQLAKLPYRSFL